MFNNTPNISIKSYRRNYNVYMLSEKPDLSFCSFIVIDKNVNDLFFNIKGNNVYEVKSTEKTKTLKGCIELIEWLVNKGLQRNDVVTAVGGGVIQDLVSFTSSILYRGVEWNFYPTTMLAQCDSCIGSKTSINHNGAKNILGGFYPPKEIFIFPKFLTNLPEDEIKGGIGEMLHYFILNHKIDLAEEIVNDSNIIDNIDKYLVESLSIKKKMIEKDEFDVSERNLFNYGHTFGHAIETISNYEINHGQAVILGMKIANRISLEKRLITRKLFEKLDEILNKHSPNYKIKNIDNYIECLKKDKKNVSNKLTCILLTQEYAQKTEIYYDEVIGVLI